MVETIINIYFQMMNNHQKSLYIIHFLLINAHNYSKHSNYNPYIFFYQNFPIVCSIIIYLHLKYGMYNDLYFGTKAKVFYMKFFGECLILWKIL